MLSQRVNYSIHELQNLKSKLAVKVAVLLSATMTVPIATDFSQASNTRATYPAMTKQSAGTIDGVFTDVTSTTFSDKIMVTVSQNGRLAQWV